MGMYIKMNTSLKWRPFTLTVLSVSILALLSACGALGMSNDVSQDTVLESRGYFSTKRLVTTEWVSENISHNSVKIVDVRKPEDYNAGHIPGALNYPSSELQVEADGIGGMLPPGETIASKLSSLGIKPTDTIVIYDGIKSLWSSRFLWTLAVYGHEDARIMDGAWGIWESEGKSVSVESPSTTPSNYRFTPAKNESLITDLQAIEASIADSGSVVLDTRSAEEYAGRDSRDNLRHGHIPTSVHVEWKQNLDAQGKFLASSELKALYNSVGIDDELDIFTLCQTAVRATHSWFVLTDLLGYENVSVYDGSWAEWGNQENTPIDS